MTLKDTFQEIADKIPKQEALLDPEKLASRADVKQAVSETKAYAKEVEDHLDESLSNASMKAVETTLTEHRQIEPDNNTLYIVTSSWGEV